MDNVVSLKGLVVASSPTLKTGRAERSVLRQLSSAFTGYLMISLNLRGADYKRLFT